MTIKIGILGYGNLGKGVECAVKHNPDMELAAVFTRRDKASLKVLTPGVKVCSVQEAESMKDEIDVMILCGGSATDLPVQTPELAKNFHVVDSFDTHARIPEHFEAVDAAAKESGHVGIISVGWDPGMFSLNRLYGSAVLPEGKDYTFWGRGVSQGHSDAIRRVEGVKDARQYTVPVEAALQAVRNGWENEHSHVIEYSLKLDSNPEFTASVIAAYARAAYRLGKEGVTGCKTVFDIAPAYLSSMSGEELRKHLL